jgi:hypothetical protein
MVSPTVTRADGVDSVVKAAEAARKQIRTDANEDEESKARAEMIERNRNAWQQPIGASKAAE